MPGAGHLVHMPSHIYMRVGRYEDSYEANVMAVKADKGYITQCRAQGLYPLAYYPHNIHFLVWSAMFQGRSKAALAAARQVAETIPADAKDNTWALNESFRSQPMFVSAGAHHYLIHTVEAFRPELGVASADKLGKLMPGAGHLVHMPSHIYMRVGRYEDSYEANVMAIKADEGYITQ